MKKLKLFFALFAMLALGVGNAWGETVTFTPSNCTNWTSSQAEQTQTIDGITLHSTGAANNTQLRLYSGATHTFTSTVGNITSILFTCTANGTNNYGPGKMTGDGYDAGTGKTGEWTGNSATVTLTGGQSRCTSIVVTYTPSAGGGETPDPEDPETPETGGDATMAAGSNGSACTVNGKDGIKVGTSSKGGDMNITVPAGATMLHVYAAAWNNVSGLSLNITPNDKVTTTSIVLKANTGIANSTPFTLSGNETDYLFDIPLTNITTETTLTFTSSLAKRFVVWGATYETAGGDGGEETAASLTANPTSLDFGNVTQNNEVEAKTFTISGSDFTTGELTITAPSGYTVNPTTVPVNGTLEETTITVTPNTSTVGTFNGNVTISGANLKSSVTVALTMTVNKVPATPTDNVYVKVTSTEGITDGEYLIVYEDAANNPQSPVAFDGSLEALDAVGNTLEVTINNNTIAGTNYIDAATFTIDVTNGTILSASGKYIGKTANSNGLDVKTTVMENTFAIDANGNAVITGNTAALRYNKAADQKRFRYYKDGGGSQEKIALYKKASKHTVTIADCTNGSVSATGVNNGDQVLSGTQITLSNTPETGYKLAAYDVYKTGDNTTKVTVTDGKFIMPEFDVTISATFELAKTLTSIEITTPATQTTFWQGEAFNSTGLKVTAQFDGAEDEDVTDKVTVNGSTVNAGTVAVEVSFTEGSTTKTVTYNITVKAIPNTKETAYTVADAFDIIDKLTTAEGVFIKGIVSQVDSYNETYKSITYWISADGTTTNQLQAYSGKGIESADFVDINGVSVEDQVIVCGDLKKHTDGTYEFNYNNYLVEHIKTTKADPELSYTPTEYNVNLGDAFTAPTLNNPHTLTVTYSSNNEDVATVATDGAVTIKAAGTVTITASFAGNEDYVAADASYNITITDPNQLEATFVAATDLGNTTRGEGSIAKSPITFACSDGVLGNGSEYRLYQDANITFAAENGYAITKVVLTSTASGDSQYGPAKLSAEDGTYTYSGKEGTWVGEAYTVTLTATAQTRATLITVYYKQDNRVDAGIAWNPATVSLTVGEEFTAPTFSNPNSLTDITFASDNEAVATVNAGVISLVSGKTGTATITATYAGNETYKPAEVKCTISVNPKTNKVVILAEREGQWYALKAEYLSGKTDRLVAVPVDYLNGTLYNVAEEVKATIEWNSIVEGDKVSFLNDGKYLKGKTSTTLIFEAGEEGLYQWDKDDFTMVIGTTERTFLYNGESFKNFATSNAGKVVNEVLYSSLPVVTTPVYSTEEFVSVYTRSELPVGSYGTICLPYASNNYTGATFFKVVGKENNKVVFDEVTELEAGKPYIFLAEATEIKVAQIGTEELTAQHHNSLQGTFTQIDKAEDNVLVGNYMVVNNVIKKCGANCGLKANRAYFVATELENLGTAPAPAPSVRRISMGVTGQNTATGVDQVQGDEVPTKMIINGQLFILRGEKMYDAQGKLVK